MQDARVPHSQRNPDSRQRLGHRKGPENVEESGGIPTGEVLGRRGGGAGLQGPPLRVHTVRLRAADVPGGAAGGAVAAVGAGVGAALVRLGSRRRGEGGGDGYEGEDGDYAEESSGLEGYTDSLIACMHASLVNLIN